ncbi:MULTISPECIES: cytoplasmic protein [unclassified Clostridium]|uniref:cytoplasmic protein n=1 Tax=unclassified Clostridium TaxID=2614128 RepID=UPI0002EB5175|nr:MULTISPECIES: cytoplasmic protein [unclassified Clostridium]
MKIKEKCGCINCLKIFYSDEIKKYSDISVICPYCGAEKVIVESSGYSIDDGFLSVLKEYWIDSSTSLYN